MVVIRAYSDLSKWELRFLDFAQYVSKWSKDPSTQVGCVIALQNVVVSLGFNGFPRGIDDAPELYANREEKLKRVIHAEANALLYAGHRAAGATAYLTLAPCSNCAGLLIQAGVKAIMCPKPTSDMEDRWGSAFRIAEDMFEQAGVRIQYVEHR